MKYIATCMILAGLTGLARTSAAQVSTAQSSSTTVKVSQTPVIVATPENPVERRATSVTTAKSKPAQPVATPDVLVRPVTPHVIVKRAPVRAMPMPMLGAERNQTQKQ